MHVILVGIGSFGYGWYRQIKAHYPQLRVTIVDPDPTAPGRLLDAADPLYTSLDAALAAGRPDFLINLTPPAVHTPVNHLAFDWRIPVLCEKPIAEDYAEAVEIVSRAQREGIPFMIAENYRRDPVFRKARQLIADGAVGDLAAVYVQFFKDAYFEKQYLLRMPEPLLVDVTVHHLDLVRYLTGFEGQRVFARSFNPASSRYPGNAAVDLLIDLENGVRVSYAGSLAAKNAETGWPGVWRIEGTKGIMQIGQAIHLWIGDQAVTITNFNDMDASTCLDEFLTALSEKREPETSGKDYLNTQKLVDLAQQSIQKNGWAAA